MAAVGRYMKKLSPQELLFQSKISKEGTALFESQAELARAIKSFEEGQFHDREEPSIKAYISQVLKPGDDPRSRPFSRQLQEAIFAVVNERLNPNYSLDSFKSQLVEAFTRLRSPEKIMEASSEKSDLEEDADNATMHFIITPTPAEANYEAPFAKQLLSILVEKSGILGQLNSRSIPITHCQYKIHVNSIDMAKNVWKGLYTFLIKDKSFSETQADKALKEVNKGYVKSVAIYSINPIACVIPTVVFNPATPHSSGYNFYYSGEEANKSISVAKMSPESIQIWKEEIFNKIEVRNDLMDVHEVLWTKARNSVL